VTDLSPEAVAQMVARLLTEANGMRLSVNGEHDGKTFHYANWLDKPRRVVLDGCRHMENSADMITTLAAENATLRADAAKALQWAKEQHACADEYAAELVTLRESEAAARERVTVLTDALVQLRDLMCEAIEDDDGNSGCGQCANDCTGCIAHAALTPTADKE